MCTTVLVLQGVPTEEPELQNPSFEKVDMPRFQYDLQKWKEWLSTQAQLNWDTFFSDRYPNLQNAASSHENPVPWDVLLAAAQRRDNRPNSASEVSRDSLLQTLLQAERRQPEVHNVIAYKYRDTIFIKCARIRLSY